MPYHGLGSVSMGHKYRHTQFIYIISNTPHSCRATSPQTKAGPIISRALCKGSYKPNLPTLSSLNESPLLSSICSLQTTGTPRSSFCFTINHHLRHQPQRSASQNGGCRQARAKQVPAKMYRTMPSRGRRHRSTWTTNSNWTA